MNENLDHSRDGSSDPGSRDSARAAAGAAATIARRRRFLTGGAATGATIVTLANRSALAQITACTISGMISGFGSAAHRDKPTTTTACGSLPGCWSAAPAASWTKAGFSKTTSAITTGLLPATVNYSGGSASFSISGGVSFAAILTNTASGSIILTFTQGSSSATLDINNGFLQQYVAAFLNNGLFDASPDEFYGHTQAAIITILANIQNAGASLNPSGTNQQKANARQAAASAVVTANANTLAGWNNQGNQSC